MSAKPQWIETNACGPLPNQPRILPSSEAIRAGAASWEEEFAWSSPRYFKVVVNCLAGVLRQFKADRPASLLLSNGGPVDRMAIRSHVIDPNRDDIAAAQLTVDR